MPRERERRAGAKPGDRGGSIRFRVSEREEDFLKEHAALQGKTITLVIREALINSGALPADTAIIDKRILNKIA